MMKIRFSNNHKKELIAIGLSTLIILLLLAGSYHTVYADNPPKQVLVLNSYHKGYKWTDDIVEGIESVLGVEGENIALQIEYMDTKRIFDEEYLQRLYETYKYKFSSRQFEVIITSDNNAFNFLLEHRDELFPNTPVVFTGVNFFEDQMLIGHDLFTGVNEEVDIKASLDIALQQHPNTKRVVIVNDTTTTGQRLHERIMEIIPEYQDSYEFVLLEDVEMTEIQEAVQALPADSLVLYTLFFRDKTGEFFEYDESISLVAEKSSVPVYGTWDFSLGYGIVGGMLTSGYYQGEMAAKLALRILNGEKVEDIPIVRESPNRYMFDNEQMERFDIPLSVLPEDSIIINKPTTFYEKYQGWIWTSSFVMASLIAIILAVSWRNVKLKQTEDALQKRTVELEQEIVARQQAEEERIRQLQILEAQQQTIQELATPVIPVMDAPNGSGGIIVMPLIGNIDSVRARDITRSLLAGISQHRAKVVILDVTGVPIVDSGVANYLNKTIQAARLKGAHTIVTGISDAVAETIVDLGIDWGEITTLSDLQTGLIAALATLGLHVERDVTIPD